MSIHIPQFGGDTFTMWVVANDVINPFIVAIPLYHENNFQISLY